MLELAELQRAWWVDVFLWAEVLTCLLLGVLMWRAGRAATAVDMTNDGMGSTRTRILFVVVSVQALVLASWYAHWFPASITNRLSSWQAFLIELGVFALVIHWFRFSFRMGFWPSKDKERDGGGATWLHMRDCALGLWFGAGMFCLHGIIRIYLRKLTAMLQ